MFLQTFNLHYFSSFCQYIYLLKYKAGWCNFGTSMAWQDMQMTVKIMKLQLLASKTDCFELVESDKFRTKDQVKVHNTQLIVHLI